MRSPASAALLAFAVLALTAVQAHAYYGCYRMPNTTLRPTAEELAYTSRAHTFNMGCSEQVVIGEDLSLLRFLVEQNLLTAPYRQLVEALAQRAQVSHGSYVRMASDFSNGQPLTAVEKEVLQVFNARHQSLLADAAYLLGRTP